VSDAAKTLTRTTRARRRSARDQLSGADIPELIREFSERIVALSLAYAQKDVFPHEEFSTFQSQLESLDDMAFKAVAINLLIAALIREHFLEQDRASKEDVMREFGRVNRARRDRARRDGAKGGNNSAKERNKRASDRRARFCIDRQKLLDAGHGKREVAGIIARRHKVTAKTVRDAFRKANLK
jgi:hypothetical protein